MDFVAPEDAAEDEDEGAPPALAERLVGKPSKRSSCEAKAGLASTLPWA